jgi:hypothetical protein
MRFIMEPVTVLSVALLTLLSFLPFSVLLSNSVSFVLGPFLTLLARNIEAGECTPQSVPSLKSEVCTVVCIRYQGCAACFV